MGTHRRLLRRIPPRSLHIVCHLDFVPELRDVNARYVELRSVVQGMESHIVHLTTRVQEEEHRADIAEGRLIALEEQFVSEAEEEEEEEEIPAHDVDSDADSTIEDA
ncbi:hypothetical protein E3N88_29179 [Mikania micrantha]|uniref:Uncharacterized protein n=1 Tax=Mikania micrantha TaxID=192012 RepID=A0A5N6MIQ2_9ASTR|nr:hypothetical protein E3N88_29179 [Mikania micrantha]